MVFSARRTGNDKKRALVRTCAVRFARRSSTAMLVAAYVGAAALTSSLPADAQRAGAGPTIERAAEALGMVRGVQRRMDSINTVEFSGRGTMRVPESQGRWTSYEVTTTTVGISYYIPAMRWDMTRRGADGSEERSVHVVRSDRAWNEAQPGVAPTPATDRAGERRRQIWLTPHGVIRAAVEAEAERPGSVEVGMQSGKTTLEVVVDGSPIVAVLDADARPERVTTMIEHPVLGRTRLEALYTDYADWPLLDVYFPSRIVQRLGNQTTLDLTITEFFQNPYVVFPTPEQLARSSP